jgi:mevalonate kinase
MFEEVITILEESDREVQQALRGLERKWGTLSHTVDELVAKSLDSKDQTREQAEFVKQELQKSATAHQEMLSEMFLVIDTKIDELTKQVDQKIEALAHEIEADMREAAASQERRMQELEAKCMASNNADLANLENRLARLERKASTSTDDLNEVFAGGLTTIADRLKAMRDKQAN